MRQLVARWCDRTTGGAALFPLVVLFGPQRRRRARPHAFGVAAPRDPRRLRPRAPRGSSTVVALGVRRRARARAARRLLRRPHQPHPHGRDRRASSGACSRCSPASRAPSLMLAHRAGRRRASGAASTTRSTTRSSPTTTTSRVRPKVYAVHRAANSVGQSLGPLLGGLLGFFFGWRTPFFVFAIPTVIFVILALAAAGARAGRASSAGRWARPPRRSATEESAAVVGGVVADRLAGAAPCGASSPSLPFLAVAIVGLLTLGSLFYEEVFGLNEVERGVVAGVRRAGADRRLHHRHPDRDPAARARPRARAEVPRRGDRSSSPAAWIVFSQAPEPARRHRHRTSSSPGRLGLLAPGIFAALSLAVPPKVRSFGFAVAAIWVIPGLLVLPIVGGVADELRHPHRPAAHGAGVRRRRARSSPRPASQVKGDIQRVWTAAAAQSEVAYERAQGRVKLLLVRGVDVALRRGAGAVRRRLRDRRGRDRRPARHQRRREVDAAARRSRASSSRAAAPSSSTAAT